MIVNDAALALAFKGFKTLYSTAFANAPAHWDKIAMTVPSSSREETYGWLGQFPQLREWIGDERVVKSLEAHGFTIVNRKFESTVTIARDDFEDDRLGVFKPVFTEMGHTAKAHPDTLIFPLLAAGFATLCYDGQNFFDTDHPFGVTYDANGVRTGVEGVVSNVTDDGTGTSPPWYLFDTRRGMKPIIWQERKSYEFTTVTRPDDYEVFMTDKYHYGIRARVNAGFGLWQLAHAVKAPLDAANYSAARRAMMELKGDQGHQLGIVPNLMVVPPVLEETARILLNADTLDGGQSNPWKGTADLVVTPYLA